MPDHPEHLERLRELRASCMTGGGVDAALDAAIAALALFEDREPSKDEQLLAEAEAEIQSLRSALVQEGEDG